MVEETLFSLKDYEDMRETQIALKEESVRCIEKLSVKNIGWSKEQVDEYVAAAKQHIEKNDALIELCTVNIERLKKEQN
nr:hypothetical protein [uncultured Selenomonas sp.]